MTAAEKLNNAKRDTYNAVEPLKVKLLDDGLLDRIATPGLLKKVAKLNEAINRHNENLLFYAETKAAAMVGEVEPTHACVVWEQLPREAVGLGGKAVHLIVQRRQLMALIHEEYSAYQAAKRAELIEAERRVLPKVNDVFPDVPQFAQERAKAVAIATQKERAAVEMKPSCFYSEILDAQALDAAKDALGKHFRF